MHPRPVGLEVLVRVFRRSILTNDELGGFMQLWPGFLERHADDIPARSAHPSCP